MNTDICVNGQMDDLTKGAVVQHAEEIKAVGSVFLILDPDGHVRRQYRIPNSRSDRAGHGNGDGSEAGTLWLNQ